jgi:hypothetical protein
LIITVEIGAGRDITGFGAVLVSTRGLTPGRGGRGAAVLTVVSLASGLALAIGTGTESGPVIAKFAVVSV